MSLEGFHLPALVLMKLTSFRYAEILLLVRIVAENCDFSVAFWPLHSTRASSLSDATEASQRPPEAGTEKGRESRAEFRGHMPTMGATGLKT